MTDQSALLAEVTRQLAAVPDRVFQFELGDEKYWVKRPENLETRMRLQKGSPLAAFERERAALRKLNALGAPVPKLFIDQPEFIVIQHCGPSLLRLRSHRERRVVPPLYFEGGAALARLHGFGHTHGRPALKDMCWKHHRLTIIDFERSRPSLDTRRGQARDIVLLFINALFVTKGVTPEIEALRDGYQSADDTGLWEDAVRWSRNLTWMSLATRPLHFLPLPLNEVRTLPVARDFFRAEGS